MKRSLALILLAFFLCNFIGIHTWFAYTSFEHKEEMMERLDTEGHLTTLRINTSKTNAVVFSRDHKEVNIDGQLYDVKNYHYEGDDLVMTCIADEYEKELLMEMASYVEHDGHENSQSGKQKNNEKGSKEYFPPHFSFNYFPSSGLLAFDLTETSFNSPDRDLFIPPPEAFTS